MKKNNASITRNSFKMQYFVPEYLVGKYQFPVVFAEKQTPCEFLPFNLFMSAKDKNVGVHFFIDDYQFERVWNVPEKYISILQKAKVVLGTDFSMYVDMPKALQIYNCYRNRALTRFLKKHGVNIVPTVCWSDAESYDWCFDGIAKGSAVAVSSNGCMNKDACQKFIAGFNEMQRRIKPCQIFFVGKMPDGIQATNIVQINSHGQNLTKER